MFHVRIVRGREGGEREEGGGRERRERFNSADERLPCGLKWLPAKLDSHTM